MYIKILTYNVDGLPESLDLKELKWYLKPLCWIYRLFKKTTVIKVNDNINVSEKMKEISKYLSKSDANIIAVQEDFNYHNELISKLKNYESGTYSGKLDLSKVKFPFKFNVDGINIFFKGISSTYEKIVRWDKSHGYFSNANDKLTTKGFRYYQLLYNNKYIDIYVIHMDADFYKPGVNISKDVKARKLQLEQLANHIITRFYYGNRNPIIIMGDTNSYNKYEWDSKNIEYFINEINNTDKLICKEACPINYEDCDRIFFINYKQPNYRLELKECYFDKDITLSDHKPLIAIFDII